MSDPDELASVTDLGQFRLAHPPRPRNPNSKSRKVGAEVIHLFIEDGPDLTDAGIEMYADAFTYIRDSLNGHKFNAAQNWLAQLGQEVGYQAELAATIRLAEFVMLNPQASLTDIKTIIFEQPY